MYTTNKQVAASIQSQPGFNLMPGSLGFNPQLEKLQPWP